MRFLVPFVLLCLCLTTGCNGGKQKVDFLVTIYTDYGDIKLILYDSTPVHKQNFLKLVTEKAYDSTTFHRVIDNFMIQGGDVTRKPGNTLPDTTLPAEFVKSYFHRKGAVAAARQGDNVNPEKRSSAYQFYIVQGAPIDDLRKLTVDQQLLQQNMAVFFANPNNAAASDSVAQLTKNSTSDDSTNVAFNYIYKLIPQIEAETGVKIMKNISKERLQAYQKVGGTPYLDDTYTVFGQVLEGFGVLQKIAAVETNADDSPKVAVTLSVRAEEVPVAELRARYGLDEEMRLP